MHRDQNPRDRPGPISRRAWLGSAAVGLTGVVVGLVGCGTRGDAMTETDPAPQPKPASTAMPTAFIPHGGGPWPVLSMSGMPADETQSLAADMRSIATAPQRRPRALLVISAHWETPTLTVNTGPAPGMYYDYGGFPEAAYQLEWPAPGDPELAAEVRALLDHAGMPCAEDRQRGYDHGTFIPLMLAYPQADVPVVQLSLRRGLDPAEHLAIGEALAPLREQGVTCSAAATHFTICARYSAVIAASSPRPSNSINGWPRRSPPRRPSVRACSSTGPMRQWPERVIPARSTCSR
jgi:hypothetical protein